MSRNQDANANEQKQTISKMETIETMSNNKQSMKLYTEEQLKKAIAIGFDWCHQKHIPSDDMTDTFIKKLTPIKLPSDEEVEQYLKSFPYTKHLDDGQYNDGVIVGAELAIEWMRDKIQGGNNEQQ